MRFLFFTDPHIRGTTPQNRKDNLFLTLQAKIKEVIALARKYRVDALLLGGDLFDRPDIAPSIVSEFAVILRQVTVPIFAVAGNHDIFGQNPETLPRTMLGLLNSFAVLRLLPAGENTVLSKNGVKIQLTGRHYHYDLDRRDPEQDYCVKKADGVDYAIHLVHGMLLEKPFHPGIPHTLLEQIVNTEADVTLCGHYHSGYDYRQGGIVEIDGKYYINPGSLVRINNSTGEILRMPRVILLDFDGPKPVFTPLPLRSAQPGADVLDRTIIQAAEFRENKLAEFVRGVEAGGDRRTFGVSGIIDAIAGNAGITNPVRQEAIRRIAEVQQSLLIEEADYPANM
ncbi:MAG: metallophosphoesterase family protein [bacterium]|jgi:exonuclease SbcD